MDTANIGGWRSARFLFLGPLALACAVRCSTLRAVAPQSSASSWLLPCTASSAAMPCSALENSLSVSLGEASDIAYGTGRKEGSQWIFGSKSNQLLFIMHTTAPGSPLKIKEVVPEHMHGTKILPVRPRCIGALRNGEHHSASL
jgi:hypothetical protein